MSDDRDPTLPRDLPFGTYALPAWAAALARFCQRLPVHGIGKRLAFVLRKPVLWAAGETVDADVQGARFRLKPRTNLSDKRLLCTPALLDGVERDFLAEKLPPGSLLLDVGANIGGYGLLVAAARPDMRVVTVEADPVMAARLRANIAFSGFAGGRVALVEAAATPEPGTVTLRIDEKNRGKNSVSTASDVSGTGTLAVPGLTLRQIIETHGGRCDALKMDIEGYEFPVLQAFIAGAPRDMWPRYVQIEQHRKEPYNDAINLLLASGYRDLMQTRMNVILELS